MSPATRKERAGLAIPRIRQALEGLEEEARKTAPEDAHREVWSVVRTLQHLCESGYLEMIKATLAGEPRPSRRPPSVEDVAQQVRRDYEARAEYYGGLTEEQLSQVVFERGDRRAEVVDLIEAEAPHLDVHREQIAEIHRNLAAAN